MRLDIETSIPRRRMSPVTLRRWLTTASLLLLVGAAPLVWAVVIPQDEYTELHQLRLSNPGLHPTIDLQAIDHVRGELEDDVRSAWSDFTTSQNLPDGWNALIDRRSGLVEIAEGAGVPWVPGHGNQLQLADLASHLRGGAKLDVDVLESIARSFLSRTASLFGSRAYSLRLNREASGRFSDYLWFVEFHVYAGALQIEGARVFFRVNNGNLVQFGAEKVPAPETIVPDVRLGRDEALLRLESYADLVAGRDWFVDKGSLVLLPVAAGGSQTDYAFGRGYELLPVWELSFRRGDEHPTWRARVNAVTGEIAEFNDVNRYSQVTGGYWPVAWKVDGTTVNQVLTGWPFTSINPLGATSNTSGLYSWDGNPQTAYHTGPYVTISDSCTGSAGTASSDAAGNIDFGTFNPPDPSTPGDCTNQLGIGDNTPAARQQYWHVNKIKEKARSYFPSNTWLQQQLGVNVNINLTCNAFWNGSTLNFYRTNGSCYNLGANAGVSMHEWGHGMDSNDGNGSSIDNGTGETYGDFSAALQTLNPCVGNGIFTSGVCGGYGNPCIAGGCDGVRDIDWGRHTADAPMTVASFTQPLCPSDNNGNYNGPCGDGASPPDDKEGHCESYVSSGAVWDLAGADLQSGCTGRNAAFPDYNCPVGGGGPYNQAGAWGVVDRLWYLSRPTANQAFTCFRTNPTWTSDGCNAGSNWTTFRAIDDDDGNLANGTPHACQIAAAFNRHLIGNTPGSSCASANTTCFRACPQPPAPVLSPVTVGNNQNTLDWTPDPAPDVIDIYRNEIGCSSGFAKIAEDVTGTLFVDNGVANGTTYYYQIVRHPVGNEACASAPSNCVSGMPATGPSAKYVSGSATLISVPVDNDSDGFVDNCETGRIRVGIVNDGAGALTNVRFTVTTSEAAVTIVTGMPINVGGLAVSSQTTGAFDFELDGATCGQTLGFSISVTADEMAGSNLDVFTHGPVEQDLTPTVSRTDDFETGDDGWTFVQGYARENNSGAWSVHSSSGLDDQTDAALSPVFVKGAGATSVVIAERHDIEAPYWDRANVHAVRLSDGSHSLLVPTGRTYTTGTWNDIGHVGTEDGWADTDLTWGDATFDLSGLVAGESYQLEVNYNTDGLVVGTGHWFDNVRWSNVAFQECDTQTDLCTSCTPPDAPTGLTASATAANQITLSWNAVVPAPSSYRIYRATTMGGPYGLAGTVGGGTLTFNDTGLTAGVTYHYVVRAFELCESDDSNEAFETAFGDCTTPPTFGGLTAVTPIAAGGSCGLRLEWAAGANNCNSGPLVYNIYRDTTSGFTPGPGNLLQSCVTNAFFDDTAVTGGTTYYYVVRAEDDTVGGGGPCRTGNEEANTLEVNGAPPSGAPVLLYDQTANQGPGYTSQSFSDFPTFSNERGADFVVGGAGWTIDRIVVAGSYNNPLLGLNPTVDVRFFSDDGGAVPLSLPQDPAVCSRTGLVSGVDFVDTAGNFDITLPTPCVLPVGRHWVSVVANRSYNPGSVQWYWNSVTAIGGSEHAWRNPGDGFGSGCTIWSNGSTGCGSANPDVAFQVWGPGSSCSLAPNRVLFLTASATTGQNVVEWLNPSGGGYGSTMVRWSTADYPADPTSGALLVDQNNGLGGRGSATHGGLINGTTYFYSVFVDNGSGDYSARKTVSARPFDTSGNVTWAYSTGASALAPPGIGSVYGVANDRVLHSMDTAAGGTWPSGWNPLAMNGPAQTRPPIVPVAVGGATKVAFLGSHDRRVYAVDADTGQQLWLSQDLGAMVQAAPAGIFTIFGGAHDLLVVGTRAAAADNDLYALNLADGSVAWTFSNTAAQGGDDLGIGVISGTVSLDYATTRAYFTSRQRSGGSTDTVWCVSFNGAGATRVWSRALGDIDASPILIDGKLYVGTNNGVIHALDAATGTDLWAAPFATGDGAVKGYVWPLLGTDRLLFSTTGTLWSITDNGANASLDWSVSSIANPSVPLTSNIGGGAYAWVGSSDGRLYQLEISAVPVITSVLLGSGTASVGSPAMDVAAEVAYVGTEDGRLYSVILPLP